MANYIKVPNQIEALSADAIYWSIIKGFVDTPAWVKEAWDNGTIAGLNEKQEILITFLSGSRYANHNDMIVFYGGAPTECVDYSGNAINRSNIGVINKQQFDQKYKLTK